MQNGNGNDLDHLLTESELQRLVREMTSTPEGQRLARKAAAALEREREAPAVTGEEDSSRVWLLAVALRDAPDSVIQDLSKALVVVGDALTLLEQLVALNKIGQSIKLRLEADDDLSQAEKRDLLEKGRQVVSWFERAEPAADLAMRVIAKFQLFRLVEMEVFDSIRDKIAQYRLALAKDPVNRLRLKIAQAQVDLLHLLEHQGAEIAKLPRAERAKIGAAVARGTLTPFQQQLLGFSQAELAVFKELH
jgi:hypothetical protein